MYDCMTVLGRFEAVPACTGVTRKTRSWPFSQLQQYSSGRGGVLVVSIIVSVCDAQRVKAANSQPFWVPWCFGELRFPLSH